MMKKNYYDEWVEMSQKEIKEKERGDDKLLKLIFPEKYAKIKHLKENQNETI